MLKLLPTNKHLYLWNEHCKVLWGNMVGKYGGQEDNKQNKSLNYGQFFQSGRKRAAAMFFMSPEAPVAEVSAGGVPTPGDPALNAFQTLPSHDVWLLPWNKAQHGEGRNVRVCVRVCKDTRKKWEERADEFKTKRSRKRSTEK